MSDTSSELKLKLKKDQFCDVPDLPPFKPIGKDLNLCYNSVEGASFVRFINGCYEKCIFWKKNMFRLPNGNGAKRLINLMSFWIEQFNQDSPFVLIALKVFMIIPNLILQKTRKNSKNNEHVKLLNDRMNLWDQGKFWDLLKDAEIVQRRLSSSQKSDVEISRLFSRFMLQGKVNAALRLLSESGNNGVLPINEENKAKLIDMHPQESLVYKTSLLFGPIDEVRKCYFDELNDVLIDKAIRYTKGSAGPSNIDCDFFRGLTRNCFKTEFGNLKLSIAAMGRKIATEIIDPDCLEAFVCNKLIPLNKNPGIRPIGVGEYLRRIIGKAIGGSSVRISSMLQVHYRYLPVKNLVQRVLCTLCATFSLKTIPMLFCLLTRGTRLIL